MHVMIIIHPILVLADFHVMVGGRSVVAAGTSYILSGLVYSNDNKCELD